MATKEAKYQQLIAAPPFEVRAYEAYVLAEVLVEGDFAKVGNNAFNRLFKYISGHNRSRHKITMTSPVSQAPVSEKIAMISPVGQQQVQSKWAISFTMPVGYTLNTLPEPKDPKVKLRDVPARQLAVIRYSGGWSERRYQLHKAQLYHWIKERDFCVVGEPIWARYDPPFKLWFLRRNEVLVPIAFH